MADAEEKEPDAILPPTPSARQRRSAKDHSSALTTKRGQDSLQYSYEGKLPPAEQAGAWARLLPDAPDRILALAEREQQHDHAVERAEIELQKQLLSNERRELETRRFEIESSLKARTLGTICAAIIVALFLALSAYMVHEKQGLASLVPLITAIGVLAAIFITGNRQEAKSRKDKAALVTRRPRKQLESNTGTRRLK